eukprot:CAMPEP_0201968880 /NCGR_PEP_ID=MMETSP0904-20121228/17532_1 /ASSEMBLY_ACC=CAM_ASM_000553 /TAXON_ID=420261 /ORGANISM="Thalassiosira antarctica, Strain CCMP982" /LENGTH=115 /DNA_ID=CAMNT_0048516933 /DNA_START=230 /DNA_END=578 /DNA_ORIENTATION=-
MELGSLELLLNIMGLKLVVPPPDMSNIAFWPLDSEDDPSEVAAAALVAASVASSCSAAGAVASAASTCSAVVAIAARLVESCLCRHYHWLDPFPSHEQNLGYLPPWQPPWWKRMN